MAASTPFDSSPRFSVVNRPPMYRRAWLLHGATRAHVAAFLHSAYDTRHLILCYRGRAD